MDTMNTEYKVWIGKAWEDTPVIAIFEMLAKTVSDALPIANGHARQIARATGREVRWNFKGVQQGHYTQP